MSQSTDIRMALYTITKNSIIVTLGMYEIKELKVETTKMQSGDRFEDGTQASTLADQVDSNGMNSRRQPDTEYSFAYSSRIRFDFLKH